MNANPAFVAPSLEQHPCWSRIIGSLQVEKGPQLASGKGHRRIELITMGMPDDLIARLQGVNVRCCSCGLPIHPLRARHGKTAGRASRPGRLYLSVACELGQNIGCARGKAASEATERLAAAIAGYRPPASPEQPAPAPAPVSPRPALPPRQFDMFSTEIRRAR